MTPWPLIAGAVGGVVTGWAGQEILITCAEHVALIIKNLLALVSLPVIFLSIVSSLSGMEQPREARVLGLRVLCYTLGTTIGAALVGLVLFFIIKPVRAVRLLGHYENAVPAASGQYADFFLSMFPSNLVQAFSGSGGVMAVVFLGFLFGAAVLTLPVKQRAVLREGFSALFALMLAVTRFILLLMPLAVWAFTALFVTSLQMGAERIAAIGWYALTVVLANIVQGVVVLPLLVRIKGIDPLRLLRAFRPALFLAFVSKSSNMTLPVTLECAQQKAGISERVARFCLPLCATINMNGCAAFILITLLFVASCHGVAITVFDLGVWLLLATLAAIGNAGVPMGCFFLTTAFLVQLHLPLDLMGVILPIYALLDMVETALNVWSDACVTAVVQHDSEQ